jgi:hypothetical protein
MIKVSLNMDITLTVSPEYLQRLGLNLDDKPGDMTLDSDGNPTPIAQSAINQCFRNNNRVLDSLMITNIEVES